MSDESGPRTLELLQKWHSGSREALEALIELNIDWLRAHVHNRIGGKLRAHDETQDYVQEAVIDVLTYGPRFEIANETHFRALLCRVVENNLRDKNRWLGRQRRNNDRVAPLASDTVLRLDPPVESVTRPSEAAARGEREVWIRLAVELLDPKDRDVLRLREWEGLSFEAIAEQLGITTNAARLRHRHALPRLARKVKDLRGGNIEGAIGDPAAP